MTSSSPTRALIGGVLAGALALTLSACGGSPGSASSPLGGGPSGPIPEKGQGLTPQTIALIEKKYGHSPELKEAALAWAEAEEAQMAEEIRKGVFDKNATLKSAHAQLCLSIKGERLGTPLAIEEISKFVATWSVTPDRLRAVVRSNKLASGNPLTLYMSEAKACGARGLP
jgi:hypothetical protein